MSANLTYTNLNEIIAKRLTDNLWKEVPPLLSRDTLLKILGQTSLDSEVAILGEIYRFGQETPTGMVSKTDSIAH